MSNIIKQKSSLCPTNGRQTVGDGASLPFDTDASVLAVCHLQGTNDMYYYSTTFSGGPGVGVFDAPKPKCPPDRGSSACVTGSPALIYSTTSSDFISSSPESHYPSLTKSNNLPPANTNTNLNKLTRHILPVATPRAIPARSSSELSTPPLTPDDGDDSDFGSLGSKCSPSNIKTQEKDALDFLMTLFPHQGLQALPYAKKVSISAPNMGASFDGVVLELPGKLKTLYVDGKSAESVSLRESIVALLDLADESLGCSALVIVLERASPNLGALLHSLMYVGGTVVTKPVFRVDPGFVLVGLEI